MLTKTRSVLAVHSLEVSASYYRDVLGMSVDAEIPGWKPILVQRTQEGRNHTIYLYEIGATK